MARLKAKEKVLYYPTPLEIVETIISNIIPSSEGGAILDPCAGTGEPLALLGQRLGLTTYGNELDPGRFAQAATRLDHCLNGAREFLQVEGQFNLLYNNPPYDQRLGGGRMEVDHIHYDLALLASGGLGIWVIPETIIDDDLCHLLTNNLSQVQLRRFPMPEYERFKQVVVFGIKRAMPGRYTYQEATRLVQQVQTRLPVLRAGEFDYRFSADLAEPVTGFEIAFPDTGTLLDDLESHGVQTGDAWQSLFGVGQAGLADFQPVLRLTSGHTAFVIAAGIVDGTEVEIESQPHLIKGSTGKQVTVTEQVEPLEEGSKRTIREREKLVQTISALNLGNGTLLEYNSLDDKDGFAQFLLAHQETLVQTIDRTYPPLFEPERDMATWLPLLAQVRAPGRLPGQPTSSGLLPAQQVRAAALAAKLQTDKAVVLVGEMGSGKTCCSQAIAALIGCGQGQVERNWKLVVVCPSQVTHKWKREAEKVLAGFGVKVHLIGHKRKQTDGQGKVRKVSKPVLDVIRAMDDPQPGILVLSYETAKNGPRWVHAPARQRRMLRYHEEVEQVETLDHYPYERVVLVEKEVVQFEEALCCPDCGEVLMSQYGPLRTIEQLGNRQRKCSECGAPLWQQVPFKYGGRTAIADFLNRHYSGRYNLILDEAHHGKGADTDAGYAAADLVAGAKKVIAMTGTVYAGKASSIFFLLYRLFPHFRQLYGYNEVQRFIEHHGLQETITTVTPSKKWSSSYGYNRENVRVKEIPGVSPGMVTLLLNNTAFLKLADMGLHLPAYSEERLPVPLDERLTDGLQDIDRIYDQAAELARQGQPGMLSAWLYASLGWPDCPLEEALEARNREGAVIGTGSIQGLLGDHDELLDPPLAKDQALIEVIEAELAQGRGVGVYFAQVNRRDWMGRVQKLLQQRGIYSEILRQNTCKPEGREAWYRAFVKRCRSRGQEPVLLANGSLVKEGLDLIELPTLIETGIEYRINDLRQRDRRSWRLIQDRPVRVIFLYYQDSMQETALQLVAAKLKAARLVDGDLAQGLAAMDVDDGNLMDALMKAVARQRRINRRPEWSDMAVAQVTKPTPDRQPALLPDEVVEEADLTLTEVVVGGGAVQLAFLEFE